MAEHSKWEIDAAWQTIKVSSAKGDVGIFRVNSISKEVEMQTHIGDGNQMDWRHTHVSYDAIMAQSHEVIDEAPAPAVMKPVAAPKNNKTGVDLASVPPPFAKKGGKDS